MLVNSSVKSTGGRTFHRTVRTRPQAEKLLARIEAELALGVFTPPAAKRTTFDVLATLMRDDYKVQGRRSTARLETALTHLSAAFRGMRVLTIDCARIRAYERQRLDEGAARATVNKELSALRRAFNLGEEAGLVQKKPRIHTPDPRNRRVGFITPEDFTALLAALPDELKPPVEFAYLTAWRKSEVLGLTWDRVDFTAQTVRLDTSKSDEPRLFPFGLLPQLAALLKTQRDRTKPLERATGRIIPWVFHREGQPIKSYDGAWHAACDRAAHEERNGVRLVVRPQLLGRVPHDLRRCGARNLRRAGVDEGTIMKLCGWKTRSMFDRYNIIDERDLNEGVRKLAAATG